MCLLHRRMFIWSLTFSQSVREASYFYFFALFCPVDLNKGNMLTVAEGNLLHLQALMKRG